MGVFSNWPRVINLEAGVTWVVTDIHGDWDVYRRCRDHFLTRRASGQADHLVFTGDLIHNAGSADADRSLDIVFDLMALRQSLGERLIVLLGNHEMPHLYGVTLARGEHVYTPRFEAALGAQRPAVLAFFDALPFYVRTRAGVALCHAGAAAEMSAAGAGQRIFSYSHQRVQQETLAQLPPEQRPALRAGLARLCGQDYDHMARQNLAVAGPDDPRYDKLLLGFFVSSHPDFKLLWAALFSRNERASAPHIYAIFLDALLRDLSDGFYPQEVLVSGHMVCRGGYALVVGRQLRLASGPHARPYHSARYLIFDAARPVRQAEQLIPGLKPVFTEEVRPVHL